MFENFRRKLKKVHIRPQDSEEEKNEGPETLRGVLSATKNIHYLYVYIYITAYTHNHPSPTHFRIYNTYPPLDYYWCFKNRLRRTERIIVLQISDHTPRKMRRIHIYIGRFFFLLSAVCRPPRHHHHYRRHSNKLRAFSKSLSVVQWWICRVEGGYTATLERGLQRARRKPPETRWRVERRVECSRTTVASVYNIRLFFTSGVKTEDAF